MRASHFAQDARPRRPGTKPDTPALLRVLAELLDPLVHRLEERLDVALF